jgi:hypothetical protein
MKGVLPWLVRWACRAGCYFWSALAFLVGPVQNIFSSSYIIQFLCPHRPASWLCSRAGSPVSLYVTLVPIHLSFNSQQGLSLSSPSGFSYKRLPGCDIYSYVTDIVYNNYQTTTSPANRAEPRPHYPIYRSSVVSAALGSRGVVKRSPRSRVVPLSGPPVSIVPV